ncbi:hypothetical protein ACJVQT_23155 [Enterobacter huaxiensis]|uniref:hypothetical protein n=1 Tax=Enterobacter huaxiensis TaxID=2494702 RepID=UPI002175D277|nr:hypothetical protein [Enterobacter huaxiensis]MCS5452477.1 hypothetical protein [Enterobacter huaxiensis]
MAPRLIDSTGFARKLDNPEKNKEHTSIFLNCGTKHFDLEGFTPPFGYQIRRSMDGREFRLVAGTNITAYYVKLKESSHILPGVKHVTQVAVWRSDLPEHEAAVTGLPKLMFAYLVKHYTVVISDEEQTPDGARFWRARIRQAIASPAQFVYAWDGTKEDAEPTAIQDQETFSEEWESVMWGADRNIHQHRLFIISGKPLGHPDYWISR